MREIVIGSVLVSADAAKTWIEDFALKAGLVIAIEGRLAKFPGSWHWHFRRAGAKGTLEATWSPADGRIGFKVARNREADWIDAAIEIGRGMFP